MSLIDSRAVAGKKRSIAQMVRILTGATGIEVVSQGTGAYVTSRNGKPVLLSYPEIKVGDTEERLDVVMGMVYHECAHVFYTDFQVWEEKAKDTSNPNVGTFMFALNVVEDIRIEKLIKIEYENTADTIGLMRHKYINAACEKYLEEALKTKGKDRDKKIIQAIIVCYLRAIAGQKECADFLTEKDYWKYGRLIEDRCGDLRSKFSKVHTMGDAVELAAFIYERLRGDLGMDSDVKNMLDHLRKTLEKRDGGKSERPIVVYVDGKPAKGVPNEDEAEDSDVVIVFRSDSEDGEISDEKVKENSDKLKEELEAEGKKKCSGEDLTEGLDEKPSELGDIIEKYHNDEVGEVGSYAMFSNPYDKIATKEYFTSDQYEIEKGKQRIEESIRLTVRPLSNKMRRLIESKSRIQKISGLRRGRLNNSALFRAAFNDDRLFYQNQITAAEQTAVTLMIDLSGSMKSRVSGVGKTRAHIAIESAYAFSVAMTNIGVAHEVIGFSTTADGSGKKVKYLRSIGVDPSCHEVLSLPLFKGFKDPAREGLKNLAETYSNLDSHDAERWMMRSNVDGESILHGAKRLIQQDADRRIMIVLSDGQPAFYGEYYKAGPHLSSVVKMVEEAGIDVIGIGIETTDVCKFYKNHLVLKNVAELSTNIIEVLMKKLV